MTQASFSVDTLTDFLTMGETHYYIFDLGRLVRQIPNDEFAAMEAGQRPYPTPSQQHAWLAIVFWRKDAAADSSPFIWFAKFPLDERGLISHAARQHYLQIIVEALGRDITADASAEQAELLKQNPYIFTPPEAKRAAFHAQVSRILNQPPSIFFDDVQSFMLGQREPAKWQQLGAQGVHDMAARLEQQPEVSQRLHQQLPDWPEGFVQALASALEHQVLPDHVWHNLSALFAQCVATPQAHHSARLIVPVLRSLSATIVDRAAQSPQPPLADGSPYGNIPRQLQRLLSQPSLPTEIEADLLIIIGARCWPLLSDETLRTLFLQRLSQHGELFTHVFADLVTVPALRMYFLTLLRDPAAASEPVQQAIDRLKSAMMARQR
ncbi:MAG: DUF3549 family protein [Idiomarina sp.]|nr:DUF3549 family protein [Idiomarina sp.]